MIGKYLKYRRGQYIGNFVVFFFENQTCRRNLPGRNQTNFVGQSQCQSKGSIKYLLIFQLLNTVETSIESVYLY